jgi:hypothetical protein
LTPEGEGGLGFAQRVKLKPEIPVQDGSVSHLALAEIGHRMAEIGQDN